MEAAAVPLWSSRRARELVAYLGLAGIAASSAAIVAGAQSDPNVLVPAAKLRYPGWLHGPLSGVQLDVSSSGVAWLLVAMCAGYALLLVCADAVPALLAIGGVSGAPAALPLAPPPRSFARLRHLRTTPLR